MSANKAKKTKKEVHANTSLLRRTVISLVSSCITKSCKENLAREKVNEVMMKMSTPDAAD